MSGPSRFSSFKFLSQPATPRVLTGLNKSCSHLPHRGALDPTGPGKASMRQKPESCRTGDGYKAQRNTNYREKSSGITRFYVAEENTVLTGRILKKDGSNQRNSHTFSFEEFKALTFH